MKKSLLITYYFPPFTGGISNSLDNFCQQFPSDKIVVLTNIKNDNKNNFKVITKNILIKNKFIWPKWLSLIYHAYRTVKRENIKLIQVGQVIPIGYVALLLKKIFKIPYIVYIYGQDLIITRHSSRKFALIKKVLNCSDGVIANSNFTKCLAIDLGIKNNFIVSNPCPQKVDLNVEKNELQSFKEKNNLQNNKIILTVGNLVERKGHDNVIKALNILNKKINHFKYLIVGNGPYRVKLEKIVNYLNLSDKVIFHNKVNDRDLKYYYASCDVFIMASRILTNNQNLPIDVEGFGMVFLEANLYKKPVIGGNNGGQPDAIDNGKSGLLVNATKVNEIAVAIEKLTNNKNMSDRMGEYGYNRVFSQFTWENQAKKIINYIKSLG